LNAIQRRFILCASAILLAARAELTLASDAEPGHDIAQAIVRLAKINGEVDLQYLTDILRLPDLRRDLTWHGPSTEVEALNVSAVYAPPNSELGIAKVYLSRKAGGTVMLQGKPAEFHSLSIFLKPGSCPAESTLADSVGGKATKTRMPGYDGGPSYTTKTFFVAQTHGAPVQISFGDDTCNLTIAHSRPL